MEDIPQPSSEKYSVGERVQIYIDPNDPDSDHHGKVCEVTEVFTDDLDSESGRDLDSHLYSLRDIETGQELPVSFRHRDLVPHREDRRT